MHGAGKNPGQHTFIRLHAAPVTELLIVTSVPDQACTLPQGNKQTLMGILNKQDYARWHSYQFYCSVGDADSTIRPEGALDVSPFIQPSLFNNLMYAAVQAPSNTGPLYLSAEGSDPWFLRA